MFRNATMADLDQVAAIYDRIHTEEEAGRSTVGWIRGVYPTRQTALASIQAGDLFVAEEDGLIVGFGDISPDGYLDRLYVHRGFQGRGIATAICGELEGGVSAPRLTVEASITARPFFEKRGYKVVKEQQVERRGVLLTNYIMEKCI